VIEFLSDEWIAALADTCRDTDVNERAEQPLVVEPVVVDVPNRGEVRYRVLFDDQTCTVERRSSHAPPADIRLETDYRTAVALARGEMNAQVALAEGTLRLSGDVARLAARASALARLDDRFAAVRATTTYPDAADAGRDQPS
jgi:hypothetical protein